MDRRDFVLGAGLSLTTTAAVAAGAGAATATDHAEHHHGAAPAGENKLAHAASHCVQAADACIAHCLDLLSTGDGTLGACARSATALRAVCDTLAQLAAQPSSPLLVRYAAVAKLYCDDCAAECRRHADRHAACRVCLEACEACAKECAALAG